MMEFNLRETAEGNECEKGVVSENDDREDEQENGGDAKETRM
jgi:hypothetical protein